MRVSFIALIFAFAFVVGPAVASAEALQLDTIRAQQATIRAGIEANAAFPYKELSADTRKELLSRQAKLLELIKGKESDGELTDGQRIEVAGTVAWIDAKLKEAEDNRMVCERRQILGSNRRERVCMTAAQMRVQREAAREQMDRRGICDDCRGQ